MKNHMKFSKFYHEINNYNWVIWTESKKVCHTTSQPRFFDHLKN